jgi:putative flippase GtrA
MTRGAAFVVVGAIGFVVQIATLAALTSLARWHWLAATVASVEIAVVHNFLWHERWTWRDRHGAVGPAAAVARFLKFNAGNGLTSLAGNAASMALLAGVVGLPPVQANILTVGVLAALNFAIADRWVFTRDSPPPPRAPAAPAESAGPATAPADSRRRRCGRLPDRLRRRRWFGRRPRGPVPLRLPCRK